MFKDMLGSDQTLFKNEDALDYSFIPKAIPYRESQQQHIATCIKPLFQQRNGKNLVVHGKPGIGKTVATLHLFREIEEETDDVVPVYVNCWQKNTTFKIMVEMCNVLGYKFTQNKNTEELFDIVKNIANKKGIAFAFDEVDKVQDFDFLYMILEEIFKKTIILITNYKTFFDNLDERIRSRLMADILEFKQYNQAEISG
ncbi:MAG: AAA family ATPase, partial [Nanoarchaeota archaeon]|nr:AAA family ATPase [Nanoarchaeota archaeon]